MKRPRSLSAEERALWDSVAMQARPLRKKKARAPLIAPAVLAAESITAKIARKKPDEEPARPEPPRPSVRTVKKAAPAPTHPIDRRERTRLARGHREIDARIDLHGMTQARAHRALLGFLHRTQADGCRYVLVITGKGKILSDGTERGVLRRLVPEWFELGEFRALVTGFEEAAIGHGGAGALYVRVRRG